MSKIDDGGPVFPLTAHPTAGFTYGMTLRDWFAGQALAGLCASSTNCNTYEKDAISAFKSADAMIAVRKEVE